jgi:hypothetical protein
MRKAIAMSLIVQLIYKFYSLKTMDLSFQGQKTEQFYLVRFKFFCKVKAKKFLKIKKGTRTVKRTVKLHVFADISGTGCDILKILTDSDSTGQVHKEKLKHKNTILGYKNIEKHAYLGVQSKF